MTPWIQPAGSSWLWISATAEQPTKLSIGWGEECRFYKVGIELLTAAGPDLIEYLVAKARRSSWT
jgi:orotidine-5'-phosphate decarboxylase